MNAAISMKTGFTFNDLRNQRVFLLQAGGSVLVNGVGRGGFLRRLAAKPNVDYITVAESDPQRINQSRVLLAGLAHKVTFVEGTLGDMVNQHIYDAIYEG